MNTESTAFQVNLIGTTWEGFVSAYTYPVSKEQATAWDMESLRRIAGDFNIIADHQIVATTRIECSDGYRKQTFLDYMGQY